MRIVVFFVANKGIGSVVLRLLLKRMQNEKLDSSFTFIQYLLRSL